MLAAVLGLAAALALHGERAVIVDDRTLQIHSTARAAVAAIPVNVLVSSEERTITATLLHRAWTPRDLSTTPAYPEVPLLLDGRPPDLELEHAGARIDERLRIALWRRPERLRGLPLWVAIAVKQAGVKPLIPPSLPPAATQDAVDRALADFSFGLSQARIVAAGPRVTWVGLVETHTPATLFISGRWAETHLRQMRILAGNALFEIANHSFTHPHMTEVPPERQREELLWTQQILYSLTGRIPRFFRPPYGEVDPELAKQAGQTGLRTVEFDFPSGDPDRHITRDRLVAWVLAKARPGSIVVMHMNRRGWHTAEALPEIVAGLRARGFGLSQVGAMVDAARAGAPPSDPTGRRGRDR